MSLESIPTQKEAPISLAVEHMQGDSGALDLPAIAERTSEAARSAIKIGQIAFVGMRAGRADKKAIKAETKLAKIHRNVEFHDYLQGKTKAYIEGTPEDAVTIVTPKTSRERRQDKRVERKLDKLAQARARNNNTHRYANSQTFGVRPAISQQLRLREAGQKYKNGELTVSELNEEKLAIRASRGTGSRTGSTKLVSVRGKDQRRTSRETTRRVITAQMASDGGSEKRNQRRVQKQRDKISKYDDKSEELRQRRQNLLP